MIFLYNVISVLLRLLELSIVAYFIASLIAPRGKAVFHLERFLAPFLRPFRVLNMKLAARHALPIDFTLLFALLAIDLIRFFLLRILAALL